MSPRAVPGDVRSRGPQLHRQPTSHTTLLWPRSVPLPLVLVVVFAAAWAGYNLGRAQPDTSAVIRRGLPGQADLPGQHDCIGSSNIRLPGANKVRLGTLADHRAGEAIYWRQREKADKALKQGISTTWDAWLANAAFYSGCPHRERFGTAFDGGKWLCAVDVLIRSKASCTVFSLGSNGEISFESDVAARLPGCAIHVWDPSLTWLQKQRVLSVPAAVLHDEAIGAEVAVGREIQDYSGTHRVNVVDILTAMQREGLDWVDIIKMDIEGFEFEVVYAMFEKHAALPATFFLVELHLPPYNIGSSRAKLSQVLKFCQGMDDMGFRIYSQEVNIYAEGFTPASNIVELAFINVDELGMVNIGRPTAGRVATKVS